MAVFCASWETCTPAKCFPYLLLGATILALLEFLLLLYIVGKAWRSRTRHRKASEVSIVTQGDSISFSLQVLPSLVCVFFFSAFSITHPIEIWTRAWISKLGGTFEGVASTATVTVIFCIILQIILLALSMDNNIKLIHMERESCLREEEELAILKASRDDLFRERRRFQFYGVSISMLLLLVLVFNLISSFSFLLTI
jgi:hypothetical protein